MPFIFTTSQDTGWKQQGRSKAANQTGHRTPSVVFPKRATSNQPKFSGTRRHAANSAFQISLNCDAILYIYLLYILQLKFISIPRAFPMTHSTSRRQRYGVEQLIFYVLGPEPIQPSTPVTGRTNNLQRRSSRMDILLLLLHYALMEARSFFTIRSYSHVSTGLKRSLHVSKVRRGGRRYPSFVITNILAT